MAETASSAPEKAPENIQVRDLMDFDSAEMYFDEPSLPEVDELLLRAAHAETEPTRLEALAKADALAPDDLSVIVALYRNLYFQHRFDAGLEMADRAMQAAGRRLNIPGDWRALGPADVNRTADSQMAMLRFYLWALKGRGYLLMRLGRFNEAIEVLEKVVGLDSANRLNCEPLLALACERLMEEGD